MMRALPVETGPLIAPSMLKCDFATLSDEIRLLDAAGTHVLHWDVMDGHFVPNLSYGAMLIQSARPRTGQYFDAHLMISDPSRYIDEYLAAGCDGMTVHIEAVPQPTELLRKIRDAGRKAGLALNPGTPLEAVQPFLGEADVVLVMSVQPGFGGQKFMPEVLPKARKLRSLMPAAACLSIDGGIGESTIGPAAATGVQLFVTGSAIFDQADYGAAVKSLHAAARNAATLQS